MIKVYLFPKSSQQCYLFVDEMIKWNKKRINILFDRLGWMWQIHADSNVDCQPANWPEFDSFGALYIHLGAAHRAVYSFQTNPYTKGAAHRAIRFISTPKVCCI